MSELPTGTVTFLFTDIEGSTRLLHELGDAYADALAEHRRVLREAFAHHGGVEVDTQGDAFFVAFARAKDALAAAAEGQEALRDGQVSVRMGLHTGEPIVTDEGYVGIDVHRAARIAAVGHGRQILVSRSTRELAGVEGLRDLGDHRLKDLTAPERIYQLGDGAFPPIKSLNVTNLPVMANPLVGRDQELSEVQALFREGSTRLVTVTGAGGSGKTRLGLQVAAELADEFPGGVFFVPLAGLGEPELVALTIMGTLGLREPSELHDRKTLLVIDNFEHLLDAAGAISNLLAAGPETRVLVTSRMPLRLDGEREYPLDPLPDDDASELLAQRARAVRPDFELDMAAVEICRRLDGLPLALELAAPRLRSLSATALLQRLDERLPLLTSGRRDAPERQRTLRATIEWSYDLLEPELRAPFARLAVFAGTCSLEGAERVAAASVDELDALVEASLLKAVGNDRFLMLQTIREFAFEQLEASGGANETRRRHADFVLALAESANLSGEAEGPQRHDLVIPEHDNARAAIDWALGAGDVELALRLAVALENFWVTRNPFEGMRIFARLLDADGEVSVRMRARALRAYGSCAHWAGEIERADSLYEESVAAFKAIGDELGTTIVRSRLGLNALNRGDISRARFLLEESLEAFHRLGWRRGEVQALGSLGSLERVEGNMEVAAGLFEESAVMAGQIGRVWWESKMHANLVELALDAGRTDEARARALRVLELAERTDDRQETVFALAYLARIAAERGDSARAGRLWGAIEAEEARGRIGRWEDARDELAGAILGGPGPEFERGRLEGQAMSLDEAVEEMLESTWS
jgi:predicted ATPase/class 3 adenylate cyclase